MGKDIEEVKKQSERLLEAEKKYLSELERIKEKQQKSDEKRAERDYNIQLSKARTAVQAAKLKEDRIAKLEKQADEEYLQRLKENLLAEEAERDRHFGDIKYRLAMGVISEEEYYRELGKLRDCYFAEGSCEWQKYSMQIAQYTQSVIEENEKRIAELLAETEENLKDYGKLYSTVNAKYKGLGPYGSDLVITKTYLADLEKQTKILREYSSALMAVKARGEIPDGLFEELRSLDVESGLRFANTLLAVSDEEFFGYINAYREKEEEIGRIATELTAENAEEAMNAVRAKLAEVYGEIPDSFYKCGEASGDSFAKAFSERIERAFDEIRLSVEASVADMLNISGGNAGTQNNNTYNASYNFYGSGESVASQLQAAQAAAVVERMRGGYDT